MRCSQWDEVPLIRMEGIMAMETVWNNVGSCAGEDFGNLGIGDSYITTPHSLLFPCLSLLN